MKTMFYCLLMILTACSSENKQRSVPPVRVEVAESKIQDVPVYIEAIGNVVERTIVRIRPQVQGILLKAYVKQGQDVEAGDLLYEIDPRTYEAAYQQAVAQEEKDKATLEQAKVTLERNKELVEKKYIPMLTFEQYISNVKTAEAQLKISMAQVETAKINLDYCKIFSPISGKISIFNVYPGNLVLANDPQALTEIRQLDPIDIRFSIPQKEFQLLQQEKTEEPFKFEATLPKEKDRKFEGTIFFIDNHIDLNTGTILIKGVLENKDRALWPGEFVNVRLTLKRNPNALVVPASAVQTGTKGPFVFVVQPDMTVKVVNVETGSLIDSLIVIAAGLKAGEKVVTNGQLNLRSGSKIQVVERGSAE